MRGLRPRAEVRWTPGPPCPARRSVGSGRSVRHVTTYLLLLFLLLFSLMTPSPPLPRPPLPLHQHTFFLLRSIPPPFPRAHWVTISFSSHRRISPQRKSPLFFPFTRVQRLTIMLRSNENRSGNFYLCYQILLDINVSSISTCCEKSEDRLYRAALFFLKLSLELR